MRNIPYVPISILLNFRNLLATIIEKITHGIRDNWENINGYIFLIMFWAMHDGYGLETTLSLAPADLSSTKVKRLTYSN
jgi:hypothetical protein